MVRLEILKQIIAAVKKRDDWKDTLPSDGDEEFLHHYMAFEFLGKQVILSEFYNRHENNTEWFIWEGDRLRSANEKEDFIFRTAYNEGLRDEIDDEITNVISRDHKNIIHEGQSDLPSPKEDV